MTDKERKILKSVPALVIDTFSEEILGLLTGKGLTYAQAEAMLEWGKEVLKRAKI